MKIEVEGLLGVIGVGLLAWWATRSISCSIGAALLSVKAFAVIS